MSRFASPALALEFLRNKPFPEVVEELDFEAQLASLKADLLELFPEAADVIEIETEPLHILLQLCASELTRIKAAINDAAKRTSLAHGFGDSLDNFAAFWGMERVIYDEGDPDARPPIPPTIESDEAFRARILEAPERLAAAGPAGYYESHAEAVQGVRSAQAKNTAPGYVTVWVQGWAGGDSNGAPSVEVLEAVAADLETRRPLCSSVIVSSAEIEDYVVVANITFLPGIDHAKGLVEAEAEVRRYADAHDAFEHDITRAGLVDALFVPGAQNVELIHPAADIARGSGQIAHLSGITLTDGGEDV